MYLYLFDLCTGVVLWGWAVVVGVGFISSTLIMPTVGLKVDDPLRISHWAVVASFHWNITDSNDHISCKRCHIIHTIIANGSHGVVYGIKWIDVLEYLVLAVSHINSLRSSDVCMRRWARSISLFSGDDFPPVGCQAITEANVDSLSITYSIMMLVKFSDLSQSDRSN